MADSEGQRITLNRRESGYAAGARRLHKTVALPRPLFVAQTQCQMPMLLHEGAVLRVIQLAGAGEWPSSSA